jgi:hypothetical protein
MAYIIEQMQKRVTRTGAFRKALSAGCAGEAL